MSSTEQIRIRNCTRRILGKATSNSIRRKWCNKPIWHLSRRLDRPFEGKEKRSKRSDRSHVRYFCGGFTAYRSPNKEQPINPGCGPSQVLSQQYDQVSAFSVSNENCEEKCLATTFSKIRPRNTRYRYQRTHLMFVRDKFTCCCFGCCHQAYKIHKESMQSCHTLTTQICPSSMRGALSIGLCSFVCQSLT